MDLQQFLKDNAVIKGVEEDFPELFEDFELSEDRVLFLFRKSTLHQFLAQYVNENISSVKIAPTFEDGKKLEKKVARAIEKGIDVYPLGADISEFDIYVEPDEDDTDYIFTFIEITPYYTNKALDFFGKTPKEFREDCLIAIKYGDCLAVTNYVFDALTGIEGVAEGAEDGHAVAVAALVGKVLGGEGQFVGYSFMEAPEGDYEPMMYISVPKEVLQ